MRREYAVNRSSASWLSREASGSTLPARPRSGTAPAAPELDRAGVSQHLVGGHDADSAWRLDGASDPRRAIAEAPVQRMLEREAAAEAAAEAGDAARAERELLVFRHPQRDRLLVRGEATAAVLAAAEPVVATEARALARAHRT